MILALIALSYIPQPNVHLPVVHVDRLEINYFYQAHEDSPPSLTFAQYILWKWDIYHSRWIVMSWALIDNQDGVPVRRAGAWEMRWKEHNILYRVRAYTRCVTRSVTDPELLNREIFPLENREKFWNYSKPPEK